MQLNFVFKTLHMTKDKNIPWIHLNFAFRTLCEDPLFLVYISSRNINILVISFIIFASCDGAKIVGIASGQVGMGV